MTDEEIIKALECCMKNDIAQCKICAYDKFEQGCRRKLNPDILDLINRQQAEIEELKKENKDLAKRLSDADSVKLTVEYWEQSIKSEAIKEFMEELEYFVLNEDIEVVEPKCKDYESYINGANQFRHQIKNGINSLVKERTEVETNQRKEDEGK